MEEKDPEFLMLVGRVTMLEGKVSTLVEMLNKLDTLSNRLERFLIGGWDEASGKFVSGVNEKIDSVEVYQKWMTRGVWTLVTLAAGDAIAMLFRH